jgi:two-component system NtrC family sensor kinase
MIKKYPWHFVYLIFVIICLANIFQKLRWSTPTDNIRWQKTEAGLQCLKAPGKSPIKKGDILLTVDQYIIKDQLALNRVLRTRKYHRYEIERDGIIRNVGIDVVNKYTPVSYYILVLSGLIFIILTLNILNANLKQKNEIASPPIFLLMSLALSGFLIFSPTGNYDMTDFIFLFLDRLSFILFPAFLLNYAVYFPIKSDIIRKIRPRYLNLLIYVAPVSIFAFYIYFITVNVLDAQTEILILTINHFRNIFTKYFAVYILLALAFFIVSNLILIVRRHQRRFLFPLIGTAVGVLPLMIVSLVLPLLRKQPLTLLNISLFLLPLLPLSLTYYLSQRKSLAIENIIKRTIATSSIFLFIFGIFFFLGLNIEKNKLLGIFWSVAAILTAGYLFKPIESTVQKFFEQFFFRGSFTFKRKLRELIQALREERDLSALSRNFLDTIIHGFNLQNASLIIHLRKNIFYSYPEKNKMLLSRSFRGDLFEHDNLVFFSTAEFEKKYPKDYKLMKEFNYYQFLPLKTPEKLTGLVAFGLKKDDRYLSYEDWELLYSISASLSLSVENASLYSELENQLNEINLLKEFNENVIENLNLGLVVLSTLNIIRAWNYFMELKFEVLREKALNKKAYTIFGPDLWKKLHQKSGAYIHNFRTKINENEYIFDIYTSPLRDNQAREMGTIIVFEDVTEKVLIQNQLMTSEKMASLGLLSAGIAHEINTPLTGISSYCQFLLDSSGNGEHKDLIVKMQEQVERANKIVRTLLDFSRQKGEQVMKLDLNNILDESISLVEHQLKKKKIDLRKKYVFQNRLYGYSTRLQQLFINLLINAIDAITNADGTITIRGKEDRENVTVEISDNGTGIDSRHIDEIFEPFFTTKEPGRGTGLGLSIAYNIVKEHYGDIEVTSKKERGSTFTITFPLENPLRRIKI